MFLCQKCEFETRQHFKLMSHYHLFIVMSMGSLCYVQLKEMKEFSLLEVHEDIEIDYINML